MKPCDWDSGSDGGLSEDSIRRKLDHPERYRVSHRSYDAGTRFSGTGRTGTAYVIRGECVFRVDGAEVCIRQGQYCEIPEGPFDFEVAASGPVDLVRVWLLPEEFWGGPPNSNGSRHP